MVTATAPRVTTGYESVMPDILVREGLRERFEDLVGARRPWWIVVALVGSLLVAGVLISGRRNVAIVAPPAAAQDASTATPSGISGEVVVVHVSGAVRRPGLYELPAGARIADAIDVAGGPRATADLAALNLAQVLIDGVKVEVPLRGAASPVAAAPGASPAAALVSINSSDVALLESVPGIGPVKAAAIVAHRESIGGFGTIEELLEVSGIGPATLESIRPYLTL